MSSIETSTDSNKIKALVSKAINEKIDFTDPVIAQQKVVDALQTIGEYVVDTIITDALNAIKAEESAEEEKDEYQEGFQHGLGCAHSAVFRRFYFNV